MRPLAYSPLGEHAYSVHHVACVHSMKLIHYIITTLQYNPQTGGVWGHFGEF